MARTPLSAIEKRNARMLEYMHGHSSVTVEELAHYLQVSEVTVRRDLNYLLNEKMILRTSAGHYALNEDPSSDVALFKRYAAHHLEKSMIALAALNLISAGSVIGLDSSTTVLELGKILTQKENLTVVTNNLFIPAYLCQHPSLKLFLAGGGVCLARNSTEGADTCRTISCFHYDIVFLSANAFDFQYGLSNLDYETVDAKLAYLEHSDRCIVLLDSSKIGRHAGRMFLPTSRIHTVVTDNNITPEQVEQFQQHDISLVIAE